HELSRLIEHDPRLGEVDGLIENASIQLHEALSLLDRVHDDLDADPEQLEENERRLGRLHDLARKHRVPMDELGAQRERMHAEVEQLRGVLRFQLDQELAAAWRAQAEVLTASRRSAAAELSATTTGIIAELGMGGGQFLIELEPQDAGKPDPQGAERVEFLVAANAGQPPRALRKVASGGELS
ncbi:DNA repair protein RecN, partial [Klebsiella pneumoniae]